MRRLCPTAALGLSPTQEPGSKRPACSPGTHYLHLHHQHPVRAAAQPLPAPATPRHSLLGTRVGQLVALRVLGCYRLQATRLSGGASSQRPAGSAWPLTEAQPTLQAKRASIDSNTASQCLFARTARASRPSACTWEQQQCCRTSHSPITFPHHPPFYRHGHARARRLHCLSTESAVSRCPALCTHDVSLCAAPRVIPLNTPCPVPRPPTPTFAASAAFPQSTTTPSATVAPLSDPTSGTIANRSSHHAPYGHARALRARFHTPVARLSTSVHSDPGTRFDCDASLPHRTLCTRHTCHRRTS